MKLKSVKAFGFRLNPGSLEDYLDVAECSITKGNQTHVFYHNLHSLYLSEWDWAVRSLYRDAIIMVDGMPLIALLRLAGFAATRRHRLTWVDFIWPLLQRADSRGWRVFYLGSSPEVHVVALDKIRQRFPNLGIEGYHGHFDASVGSADNARIVEKISDFGADLCLIGMGTPRQENWVVNHRSSIDAATIFACGACMEYVAGRVLTPPRWMGRWGLEWSFRLLENPRRFSSRYLVEPWLLAAGLVFHKLR